MIRIDLNLLFIERGCLKKDGLFYFIEMATRMPQKRTDKRGLIAKQISENPFLSV